MTDKFKRHDLVTHRKTENVYMVVLGPQDGVALEATGEPAYVYQRFFKVEDPRLWVRSATEMEDGRFEFKQNSTHGACGRIPDA
jgi:hypothetical protein